MKLNDQVKRVMLSCAIHYQKIQCFLITVFVVGLVDYYFLYEIFISLTPFVPILAVEAAPLIFSILLVLAVGGVIKYVRQKRKENRLYSII